MIRINSSLRFFAVTLFAISAFMAGVMDKFLPLLKHVAYYCQSALKTNITQIPRSVSILPLLIVALIVIRASTKLLFIYLQSLRVKRMIKKDLVRQTRLEKIVRKLELDNVVYAFNSIRPTAFCIGMLHPKIYVSSGLIQILSDSELEAVLLHEQHHKENKDNITMAMASIVHSMLPFLPLITTAVENYRIDREIEADKFSTAKIGRNEPIISALEKLLGYPNFVISPFANIIDEITLEPRIQTLLNGPYLKKQLSLRHVVLNLVALFFLGLILIVPVHAEELHHNEHDVVLFCSNGGDCIKSCTTEKNLTNLYSRMQSQSNSYSQFSSYPMSR